MIDTEGYGAEILHLFDIPSHKPAMIRFKDKHVSFADRRQSLRTLVGLGHKVVISGEKALACLG